MAATTGGGGGRTAPLMEGRGGVRALGTWGGAFNGGIGGVLALDLDGCCGCCCCGVCCCSTLGCDGLAGVLAAAAFPFVWEDGVARFASWGGL